MRLKTKLIVICDSCFRFKQKKIENVSLYLMYSNNCKQQNFKQNLIETC